MKAALFLRAMLLWGGFVLFGAASGAVRTAFTGPSFGAAAIPLHTLALCLFVFVMTFRFVRKTADAQAAALAWRIGVMWVMLSVAFQLGVGRFVLDAPLGVLLAEYDVSQGRLWPLYLLFLLCAPRLAAVLRLRRS